MGKSPFTPPTILEVRAYAASRGCPDFDAQTFLDYYAAGNPPWHDSRGRPIRSWKQKFIAVWEKNAKAAQARPKKTKLYPIPGHVCSKPGCGMPAVYHDSGGAYDYYRCSKHLPAKVAELYE